MFNSGSLMFLYSIVAFMMCCILRPSHQSATPNPLSSIEYGEELPLMMNMTSSKDINIKVTFNKDLINVTKIDVIRINFKTKTISPQFNILSLDTQSTSVLIPRKQLEINKYVHLLQLKLHANYIGHAIVEPTTVDYINSASKEISTVQVPDGINKLTVTVVQFEGIWGIIFLISVVFLMLISYISLGAQLDTDSILQLIRRPRTLVLGFLIGVVVMPTIAWFVGHWFFERQPLYRIGSYVFACSPAASGSTLWTVMLNSDKELSVSLQVISNAGALITMPLLLYIMDKTNDLTHEVYQPTKVPYSRLIQTLAILLLALVIGWQFVGKNPRAQKMSQRIFRPLVFFVLIYIIVFSSILYWHIYQMFDWNITLASFIIALSTYVVSGMLGHCINCDMDKAIAISISSVYKNSGIAFAVLLVAFQTPDTYIAYVPCLTQIVMISMSFYLAYTVVTIYNCIRRRGQPDVIQASTTNEETTVKQIIPGRDVKSNSVGEKSMKSDDIDEFIAMDVTDVNPESQEAMIHS